jgi:hypothetical protein
MTKINVENTNTPIINQGFKFDESITKTEDYILLFGTNINSPIAATGGFCAAGLKQWPSAMVLENKNQLTTSLGRAYAHICDRKGNFFIIINFLYIYCASLENLPNLPDYSPE